MSINAGPFFAAWRSAFGKLDQGEVDGINALLSEMEARGWSDPRWWAYVLATAYHETAGTMRPLEEYGRGKGRPYGELVNGHAYYGRGFVQLTWRENYEKLGKALGLNLADNPAIALDPAIAAAIMCEGMERGLFTGKGLPDYFDADTDDPVNARRIVNGTDKASLIATYHAKALRAVKEGLSAMKPPLVDEPSLLPNRKVGMGATAAAIILYVAEHQAMFAGIPGVGPFVPLIVSLGPAIPIFVSYMTRKRA